MLCQVRSCSRPAHFRWPWSLQGPLNCLPEKPAREPPRPSRRGPQPWTSVLGKAKAELQLLFSASSGAALVTDWAPGSLSLGGACWCPQQVAWFSQAHPPSWVSSRL